VDAPLFLRRDRVPADDARGTDEVRYRRRPRAGIARRTGGCDTARDATRDRDRDVAVRTIYGTVPYLRDGLVDR